MIKIYVKDGCPFCAAVLAKVDDLDIEIEEKNVFDIAVAEELIEIGGKKQEPFFYDEEKDIKMYESSDIIQYLNKTYGDGGEEEIKAPTGVCSV